MLNETLVLQTITICTLLLYVKIINLLTLWYTAGLYLLAFGLGLLLRGGDIFVGFLWVIDFGVGLIFFIFVLHFSTFLYQKSLVSTYVKFTTGSTSFFVFFTIWCYFLNFNPSKSLCLYKHSWFYFLSWYNFYCVFLSFTNSALNLLRELYFFNNSFEFFVINFMLLYGILLAIVLTFMLRKIFVSSTLEQFRRLNILKLPQPSYFIRQQNFLRQQSASTGTRVWTKSKARYDF